MARQAEINETDDTHENTTDINPIPNVSVTGVETALACSENEPTTSSEISVSPIDNSNPFQFNKRYLSDEDRLKLLKTKWILPSNSYKITKIVVTTYHGKMNILGYVILLHKMVLTVLSILPFRITPVKIHDTTNLLPYLTRTGKNALGEKRSRLSLNSNSERHMKALEKSSLLLYVSDQTKPSIVQSISKAYSDKVDKNRASLLSLIDVIITLGNRNIAFRGNWNKETTEEDGHVMFFVN